MKSETNDDSSKGCERRGGLQKISGIFLSVLGLLWLSKRAGWMPMDHGHPALFWPVVVLAIGLFLLVGSKHRHNRNSE